MTNDACSESDVQKDLGVPAWLPLSDAEQLLGRFVSNGRFADVTSSFDSDAQARAQMSQGWIRVSVTDVHQSPCAFAMPRP